TKRGAAGGSRTAAPAVSGGCLGESLVEVADEVVRILDADREAHRVGTRPRRFLLLGGELAVGGRGRVVDDRPGVAEIDDVAEDLDRVDEAGAGLVAAPDPEGEERARALG